MVDAPPSDEGKEFTFTVKLNDETVHGPRGSVNFKGGVTTFTLKKDEFKEIPGLPAGVSYTVTEEDAGSSGYVTSSSGSTGTIPDNNAVVTAAFTNTYRPGELVIQKKVEGKGADTQKEFTFTVTLDGHPECNDQHGQLKFENGEATFILKDGDSITATGLPAGGYTVTETSDDDYVTTVNGSQANSFTGSLSDGSHSATVNFVNRYKTGDLSISKTVSGTGFDPTRDFQFTVTLGDKTINGTYGDLNFTNGTATFTLHHGETKTARELPDNTTYTVTETDANQHGYQIKEASKTGTIRYGATSTVSFVNEYHTGGLTVEKVLTPGGNTNRDFNFTVTLPNEPLTGTYGGMEFENGVAKFTRRGGQSFTATGLPAGTGYTVTETDSGEYQVSYKNQTGTIPDGGTVTATVTNHYPAGSLTVSKTVVGTGNVPDQEFHFTVTLSGTGADIHGPRDSVSFDNGTTSFTLKSGESKTIPGLPAHAHYTVTEAEANQGCYTTTSVGESGSIPDGGDARADFTNTYTTGNLSVKKNITGDGANKTRQFSFKVTLDSAINGDFGQMHFTDGVASFTLFDGQTFSASGLPAGTKYTVTETDGNQDNYVTDALEKTGTIPANSTAEVSFTNRYQSGGLTVHKSVSGSGANTSRDFTFTVTLDNGDPAHPINGLFGNMNFVDGTATFTLHHGQSAAAPGLPAGTKYTVSEKSVSGYTTVFSDNASGTIPDQNTAVVNVTNTYHAGGLSVTKILTEGGNTQQRFDIHVVLSDKSINGDYGEMHFANGVASFQLLGVDDDGEGANSKTASGLPAGITYEVTETEVNGYTASYTDCTGTIQEGKTASATITNTYDAGTLTVSKTVEGAPPSDTDREFHFTVTLNDTTVYGPRGDVYFTGGKASFSLKNKESIPIPGLPAGATYTVTEEEAGEGGYITTSTGASGTIPHGGTAEAAFTNTYRPGSLTVTKTVVGAPADQQDQAFTFTVTYKDETGKAINDDFGQMHFTNGKATFTLKDGESITADGLPTGSYEVKEEADDEYATTSTGASGTITASGASATAAFTNTYKTGELTVKKTVTGEGSKTRLFSFTVTLEGATGKAINGTYGGMTFENGVARFTLKDGESKRATGLPDGISYLVTEDEADQNGYVTTATGDSGVITYGVPAEASFTNDFRRGGLTVTKILAAGGNTQRDFAFNVDLQDESINGSYGELNFTKGQAFFTLKGGESKTAEGLPSGTSYLVTEMRADGYTAKQENCEGTIPDGGVAEAVITNTYPAGTLTVTKNVEGADADPEKQFHFTVRLSDSGVNGPRGTDTDGTLLSFTDGVAHFTLKSRKTATLEGLPAGATYTVTEEEADQGSYVTTAQNASGVIEEGQTKEAVFTNTFTTGNLVVSKTVTGNGSDKTLPFDFTVTVDNINSSSPINGTYGDMTFTNGTASFSISDGEKILAEGLPAGTRYTVTETNAAENNYASNSVNSSGTIPFDDTATATFTNRYRTGNLTVHKTVVGDDPNSLRSFRFTVTLDNGTADKISGTYGQMTFENGEAKFELQHGQYITAADLPAGTTYQVTEESSSGYTSEATGDSGQIEDQRTATAEFTNTYHAGSLSVTKILTEGGNTQRLFDIHVELSDKHINGTYGDMRFVNGVASFQLLGKSKEDTSGVNKKTATGLPAGVTYEVTETQPDGYRVSYTGCTGMIQEGTTADATITNTYDGGSLKISKTVNDAPPSDTDREFHFTVILNDTTVYGPRGKVSFTGGKTSFSLKKGESIPIPGLPAGATYTVTEEEAGEGGYITTSTGASGMIPHGGTAEAAFTNTYRPGSLTVTKTVVGAPADQQGRAFTFTVTYKDETGKAINDDDFGQMHFTDGKATFTLKDGESITADDLPTGSYEVKEEADDEYATTSTGASGTITASVTSATAAFTNTYKTGELTVKKTVTGEGCSITKRFPFTVTLEGDAGKAINGDFGQMHFKDGVATFALRHGESQKATGLPDGISYTVTEDEADQNGYVTTATGESGKITYGAPAVANFTNDFRRGGLTVTKILSEGGNTWRDFRFNVALQDTSINGSYGDLNFTEGQAFFTLKGGESKTAQGLPAGTSYSVTEMWADGYTADLDHCEGTIPDGGTVEASITNFYRAGSLTVTKKIEGEGADPEKQFHFTVHLSDSGVNGPRGKDAEGQQIQFINGDADFTLKGGDSVTIPGLPAEADYNVTESEENEEGYITTTTGREGTIPLQDTVEAVFTNTYRPGSLTVSKAVVGAPETEKDQAFEFTVTYQDTAGNAITGKYGDMNFTNGTATFTLKNGESQIADTLPLGNYEVTETPAEGYAATSTNASDSITKEHPSAAADFTNTFETGALHISMTVEGRGAEKDREFHFTVTLNDASINGPMGQFASGESQLRAAQAGDGSDAQLNFTNGVAKFTLKHGQSVLISGLPAGAEYTVAENDANQYGYRTRSEGETGSILANDTVYAVFVNNKDLEEEESGTQPGTETEPSSEDPGPGTESEPSGEDPGPGTESEPSGSNPGTQSGPSGDNSGSNPSSGGDSGSGSTSEPSAAPPAASEAPALSGTDTLQPLPDLTLALTPPINDAGEANDADTEGANVPTGDEADPFLWMALLGLSLLGLAAPWAMRKKRRG